MKNYKECYLAGVSRLERAGVPEAKLDARLLLEFVCHTGRNDLLVHGDRPLTAAEETAYEEVIEKRSLRIPLQHITGVQEFMGLPFLVSDKVLIPRQDTEVLVEEVLRELSDGFSILDLCTGSGCILLSLLHYSNDCTGLGVDISEEALQVARQNARALQETDARFVQGDLFEGVEGRFERIVSNPPYIRSDVIPGLMPEVRQYEPRLALDGSPDGLAFYRRIVSGAPDFLKRGGKLYLEIGYDQGEAVSRLLKEAGFSEVKTVKDFGGLDRVVSGTKTER